MSKKIILFLSTMSSNATEKQYRCPNGNVVSGIQTNEAPVKYLLSINEDISEIICILTKEAKNNSFEFFCNNIKKIRPDIIFTEIGFDSDKNDFSMDVLPNIINKIQDNDEIFIEATGGKRNDIIHILLLSRALTYSKVKLADATYSDFGKGEIIYITNLFLLFDFMSGMQELTSFGDVKRLRNYYEKSEKEYPEIIEFLDAVDSLFEDIVFCRTKNIKLKMAQFNIAVDKLRSGSKDHLFDALFNTFKEIFGKDKKLSVVRLIKWCLKNGMIQQALTIYTERIPEEILKKDNGIFAYVPEFKGDKQEYEDEHMKLFYEEFLKLADKNRFNSFFSKNKSAIINYIVHNSKMKFNRYSDIIDNIKIIVDTYYDRDGNIKKNYKNVKFPKGKEYLNQGELEINDGNIIKTSISFINNINSLPSEKINVLFKESDYDYIGKKSKDVRIETIESLRQCIDESEFKLKCDLETIKDISKDYMYIKAIRNTVNHANNETNQTELMEYLKKCDSHRYIDIEKIKMDEVRIIVESALDRITNCK